MCVFGQLDILEVHSIERILTDTISVFLNSGLNRQCLSTVESAQEHTLLISQSVCVCGGLMSNHL